MLVKNEDPGTFKKGRNIPEREAMNHNNLYQPTEHFSRKLEVKQSDSQGYKRIRQVVERLIAEPDNADG